MLEGREIRAPLTVFKTKISSNANKVKEENCHNENWKKERF
jgi:hypothetical protein